MLHGNASMKWGNPVSKEAALESGTRECRISFLRSWDTIVQTGDIKRRPGYGIEGAMVCTSLGSLLRPLVYFLDDVSYPQSVPFFRFDNLLKLKLSK